MSARHTSLNPAFSRYSLEKKKVRGAVDRGAQTAFTPGNGSGGPWRAAPGSSTLGIGSSSALSFCLSSPLSCSSPSPAATGFYLHCSLKPSSQRAARPSTRSAASQQLPPKLQCIITTSCSGLWAGRLCRQASPYPQFQGGDSLLLAAANSPKEVPTPLEGERAALPSLLAPRGQRPIGSPLFFSTWSDRESCFYCSPEGACSVTCSSPCPAGLLSVLVPLQAGGCVLGPPQGAVARGTQAPRGHLGL